MGKHAMPRTRETVLVVVLLLAAVLLTGRARLRLDDITASFRNDFRTLAYLPRGDALKIVAAGFDAPLADALFIKALVYYPRAIQREDLADESKLYIYELFNLVTDLTPRFYRAYQVGALFLTASASLAANRQGVALLEKGIGFYDRLEAEGRPAPVFVDPRWLYHSILATTYDLNIQSRLRVAGDAEGASAARIEAARQFRLAAASPGAPAYLVSAARGFESVLKGRGDVALARAAVLSVMEETYGQAVRRGDRELAGRLKEQVEEARRVLEGILLTRRAEAALSAAGRRYLGAKGRPAEGAEDLRRAGFVGALPPEWPLDAVLRGAEGEGAAEKDAAGAGRDVMLPLPDGTFKSRTLAAWETGEHLDVLLDGVIVYRRVHGPTPPDLETLVREGILEAVPTPPLAKLGQEYEYDRASGLTRSTRPELFE